MPIYKLWRSHVKREYDDSRNHNEQQLSDLTALKHIPLIVVSRDKNVGLESAKFKAFWNQSQREMLEISEKSQYFEIERSGHYVHKKQPKKIVEILEEYMNSEL